jgi:hypothetical protein
MKKALVSIAFALATVLASNQGAIASEDHESEQPKPKKKEVCGWEMPEPEPGPKTIKDSIQIWVCREVEGD